MGKSRWAGQAGIRKKLIEAGRYWATGKGIGSKKFIDQLKWGGAPKEIIDQYLISCDLIIYDQNWLAWEIFSLLGPGDWTYWNINDGKKIQLKRIGLKSESVVSVLKLYKSKRRSEIYEKIRVLEYGALLEGREDQEK